MVYFMALEMLRCVLTIYFMEQLFKISWLPIYFQPLRQYRGLCRWRHTHFIWEFMYLNSSGIIPMKWTQENIAPS